MAFKPYCELCRTWHTEQEAHVTNANEQHGLELARMAEATVCLHDESPGNRGKVIIGLRVDPKKLTFIGMAQAFDALLERAAR